MEFLFLINIFTIFILIIIYKMKVNSLEKSIFFNPLILRAYTFIIFPLILMAINILSIIILQINHRYILFTFLILLMPISSILHGYYSENKLKKLYVKYESDIVNLIIETLKDVDINIIEDNVNLSIYKRNKTIFCKGRIELNEEYNTNYLRNMLEKILEETYKDVKVTLIFSIKKNIINMKKLYRVEAMI